MTEVLRLDRFVSADEAYHLGRVTLGPGDHIEPHGHGFVELLWVEAGSATHRLNGRSHPMRRGDAAFVGPRDTHAFGRVAPSGFVHVNVAFDAATLPFLRDRYLGDATPPWTVGAPRGVLRFDAGGLARLGELAALLATVPPTRLALERFLLEVLHDLVRPRPGPELPGWLADALASFATDPDALSQGVRGLAALAGRSREHVNRVVRAATGETATELVNAIRMQRAAAALRMSDAPIATVAIDCGIHSLSHFYRLFNDRYGVTPRRYRLGHQALARGTTWALDGQGRRARNG